MKKLQLIFFTIIALMCLTAMQSCTNDKTETKYQVSIDRNELPLTVLADQGKFNITSNGEWIIVADGLTGTDGGWYTISAARGNSDTEITVTAKANGTGGQRIATLSIEGKYNNVSITIKQAADGDGMLEIEPTSLADFNTREAATQTFDITTPFEWTITFKDNTTYTDPLNPAIDPQWASVDLARGEGDKTITVTAKDNGTGDLRTGEFTIIAAGKPKTVTVKQLTDVNNTFDPAFLAWCLDPEKGSMDINGDGSISKAEAEAVIGMDCTSQAFTSLKGIENFTALTYLDCSVNKLISLDVTANTALTYLDCSVNKLISLDVTANTALTRLSSYINQLDKLDVKSNTALTYLDCSNNPLIELDVTANTALSELQCSTTQLATFDLSANTALITLRCHTIPLTELDLSKNTELAGLWCFNSPNLATINISGSSFAKLTKFDCPYIATGVNIYVWNGFNIADIPPTSMWNYPLDVTWVSAS